MKVLSGNGGFGGGAVVVEAEDEVGLDGFVDEAGAGADFRGAVEQRGVIEVVELVGCDGFELIADKGDPGSLFFEKGFQKSGCFEGHGAFLDGRKTGIFMMPFLEFRVFPADVAGVDGNVQAREWFAGVGGPGLPSPEGSGGGSVGHGELKTVVAHLGVVGLDPDPLFPGVGLGVDPRQEVVKGLPGDGVLKAI